MCRLSGFCMCNEPATIEVGKLYHPLWRFDTQFMKTANLLCILPKHKHHYVLFPPFLIFKNDKGSVVGFQTGPDQCHWLNSSYIKEQQGPKTVFNDWLSNPRSSTVHLDEIVSSSRTKKPCWRAVFHYQWWFFSYSGILDSDWSECIEEFSDSSSYCTGNHRFKALALINIVL